MPGLILNDHPEYRFPDYNFLIHGTPSESAVKVISSGKLKSAIHRLAEGNFEEGIFRTWNACDTSFVLNDYKFIQNPRYYLDEHQTGLTMVTSRVSLIRA